MKKRQQISQDKPDKRVKKQSNTSPLAPEILSPEYAADMKQKHDASGPYTHAVIEQLCSPERMRLIHEELKLNMKANFKETDLFKVFQSSELASMDPELEKVMPNFAALRRSIYSPEFREFISSVTGLNDLTDRVDCSANAYANGCHLLCHDDVIGTRRVSYIIYFSDPDEPWVESNGGCVELYPLEESSVVNRPISEGGRQGVPTALPSKTVLPAYNSMLFFGVQPGRSYHSVQEVFNKSTPRLSISGWFHGPDKLVGSDQASLQQIMSKGDDQRGFEKLQSHAGAATSTSTTAQDGKNKKRISAKKEKVSADNASEQPVPLSAEELAYLRQWINPLYLQPTTISDINEQFCENSSLQLENFLRADVEQQVRDAYLQADASDAIGIAGRRASAQARSEGSAVHAKYEPPSYTAGVGNGWDLVGPPHKRRYLAYDEKAAVSGAVASKAEIGSETVGSLLNKVRNNLFRDEIFGKYLHHITALRPLRYRDEVRRFRAGLDYTVAHYGVLTKESRLDATLCFVNDDKEANEAALAAVLERTGGAKKKPKGLKKQIQKQKAKKSGGRSDDEDENQLDDDDNDYFDLWDGGDVGGFECFLEADEDPDNAEAAEVYRSGVGDKKAAAAAAAAAATAAAAFTKEEVRGSGDEGSEEGSEDDDEEEEEEDESSSLLSVSASNNVLNLVMRDTGIMKFIKYVSGGAPGSRWDVSVEYEIAP